MRPGLKWGSQIRSINVPFSEARGPTHARHLAATLYRNEDYFFQIDSHSTFRQARPLAYLSSIACNLPWPVCQKELHI